MEQERSSKNPAIIRDILAELSLDPFAWTRIDGANMRLNLVEGDTTANEIEAFSTAGEVLNDDVLRGSRVKIVGFGRTLEDDQLTVMSVSGRYDAITAIQDTSAYQEPRSDINTDVLAIHVITKNGSVYFPLRQSAFVQLEAVVSLIDDGDNMGHLQRHISLVRDALRGPYFQQLPADEKRYWLEGMLAELNTELYDQLKGDVVHVQCQNYSQHFEAPGRYTVDTSEHTLAVLAGRKAEFIYTAEEDDVLLVLHSLKGNHKYFISSHDLEDIFSLEEYPAVETEDLFETWFDSSFREAAFDMAAELTQTRRGSGEWAVLSELDAYKDDLNTRLPESDVLSGIQLTGFVLERLEAEKYDMRFHDDEVTIEEVDFLWVKERYIPVLSAQCSSGEGREILVVPDPGYLARFETCDDEEDSYSIADLLHETAEGARAFVTQPEFFALSLREQRKIINGFKGEVRDHLAALAEYWQHESIDVRVKNFWALPGDMMPLGWHNPLVSRSTAAVDNTFSIVADSLEAFNPDALKYARSEPFHSVADMPFSEGEPMVVAHIKATDMYYLIRVRDIVDVAPFYEE